MTDAAHALKHAKRRTRMWQDAVLEAQRHLALSHDELAKAQSQFERECGAGKLVVGDKL